MREHTSIHDIPVGIVAIDEKELKIRFCNIVMKELTEYDEFEVLGKHISVMPFFEPRDNNLKINLVECLFKSINELSKTAIIKKKKGGNVLAFLKAKQVNIQKKNYIIITVTDISSEITCDNESIHLRDDDSPLYNIVGKDEKILDIYRMIEHAADSESNVLVYGESGTGKELIANAIHYISDRKNKPFVKVNCSALSETLLESELFGHVKGSFTGAYKDKPGKFEAANKGTIFLDEIGEISPLIQVKLLRVIQEKVIERVGDNKSIYVDMRIITATNKNLRTLVNNGKFREDLFYRLNVFPIHTVPLREHKNDIPLLVDHFIKKFNKKTGKQIKGLTEDAYRILMDYCWPGNVRELENSIEHAFVVCNKPQIDIFDLPQEVRLVNLRKGLCKNIDMTNEPAYFYDEIKAYQEPKSSVPSKVIWKNITKEELLQLLDKNDWNKTKTAEEIGISRVALWKKIKKFEL